MNTSRGKSTPITAAVASLVGSSLEWFDFYIYATAAALVFNQVFFPSYDPLVGTLLAFGTFAVAAIMRPLGGLICGHYGDRIGRKSLLVWTVVAMGAGTFLIGCLPGYASIGIAAPIALLVLRCVQAMAFGGEWAGAILVAVEHAPKKSKGFFGSFPQIGSPIGLFLSTGAFALLSALPKEDFLAWGWRIPFLASAVLILVGLVFRLRLLESPEFAETVRKGEIVKQPIVEVLRSRLRQVLVGGGAILCTTVAFFVQIVFVVTYATQSAGVPRPVVLNAILAATAVELVLLPAFAAWADRIGVKPVAILGAVMTIVFSFPFFWLVDMGTATADYGRLLRCDVRHLGAVRGATSLCFQPLRAARPIQRGGHSLWAGGHHCWLDASYSHEPVCVDELLLADRCVHDGDWSGQHHLHRRRLASGSGCDDRLRTVVRGGRCSELSSVKDGRPEQVQRRLFVDPARTPKHRLVHPLRIR